MQKIKVIVISLAENTRVLYLLPDYAFFFSFILLRLYKNPILLKGYMSPWKTSISSMHFHENLSFSLNQQMLHHQIFKCFFLSLLSTAVQKMCVQVNQNLQEIKLSFDLSPLSGFWLSEDMTRGITIQYCHRRKMNASQNICVIKA